nr:unnamed protein product [Digitaria exilis]
MAPTGPQDERGEGSGSKKRRRRRRQRQRNPTEPLLTEPSPPSQDGKRNGSGDKKGERDRAPASDSALVEHASSGASSAVSSPLRWPLLCRTVVGEHSSGEKIYEPFIKLNPRLVDACEELKFKYHEKRISMLIEILFAGRQLKLVTLRHHVSRSCLTNQELLPTRDSATKTVLKAAKVIMGLSSYVDGRLLTRTTGFLIAWNAESKVLVHLLDRHDTTVAAELIHYDRNYNLALLNVTMNLSAEVEVLSLRSELKFGQEVFVLGRDKDLYLSIDHGNVQYAGPHEYERRHFMFVNCALRECGYGAPVIDLDGEVMGMVNSPSTGFIPSATILKCIHMWEKFDCIPRLHIGMKFSAIKFLDPIQIEAIYRKCNIDEGLIVKQVSKESSAERQGIRTGDILQSLNGVGISTMVELENLMLEMCEAHLNKGNEINSTLEVEVGIFRTRSGLHCIKKVAVKVSDDIEVIPRDTYPVSNEMLNDYVCEAVDLHRLVPKHFRNCVIVCQRFRGARRRPEPPNSEKVQQLRDLEPEEEAATEIAKPG